MRHLRPGPSVLVLVVFLFTFSAVSGTASAPDKRPLSHDDYDAWRSIVSPALSSDGRWALFLETPQDGEADLVVLELKTGKSHRHAIGYSGEGTDAERAARPEFSPDVTHVVFLISPTREQVKQAKKDKKKDKEEPKKQLGVLDLATGKVEVIDRVKSFKLPEKSGNRFAFLMESPPKEKPDSKEDAEKGKKTTKPEEEAGEEKKDEDEKDKKKEYGTRLVLRSFQGEFRTEFTDVLEYVFSRAGDILAFSVSSEDKPERDGVYLIKSAGAGAAPLLTGKGVYSKLTVSRDGDRLAFLSDREDQEAETPTFNLYGWEKGDEAAALWVSHTRTQDFPDGMAVSDKSAISFSRDGRTLMLGIKEIPPAKEKDEEDEEPEKARFDLWHWNDPYPQPQQKRMADEVRDNTWESVFHIEKGSFVRLAREGIPDVTLSDDGRVGFAQTLQPYTKRVSYDGRYVDVYVFDTATGEETLVKQELYGRAMLSPGARYVFWFVEGDWYAYSIAAGTTANLTAELDVDFEQHDWDRPEPKGSYGIAGWTEGDAAILINDRYDIWEISPDGENARRITEGYGRTQGLQMRCQRLDRDERFIDPEASLLLRAVDQNTMAEGLFRDRVTGTGEPAKLLMVDRMLRPLIKARDAEVFLFSRMTYEEYPDLWTAGPEFKQPRKITDLGRQMDPFLWGTSQLRDFFSADGRPLKGILLLPDNFDPAGKYPLMVYIYETLHDMRHYYRHPSPGTSINLPSYVSNGYVIWMPDIEYETGYPGRDALKCVLPGIHMLVREGFIDPDAIGIQGHSWGGYQIAYMITQTDIFAAAEAGAPVSNMTSAYGGIRWASGMVRQFQYERTQSRLGDTLWKVPLRYIENSPLFWADRITTPVMFMHNDEDGAVPWYQGIEFIMALRRLGREAYMFNYNGEPHGLRKRVNQKDWSIRMAEFFDHHLRGAPKPDWMEHGIQAWDKPSKGKK